MPPTPSTCSSSQRSLRTWPSRSRAWAMSSLDTRSILSVHGLARVLLVDARREPNVVERKNVGEVDSGVRARIEDAALDLDPRDADDRVRRDAVFLLQNKGYAAIAANVARAGDEHRAGFRRAL